MRKKMMVLMLAVLMLTLLSACGKKEEAQTASAKDYVYRVDEMDFGDFYKDKSIYDFFVSGDRMYIVAAKYLTEGSEYHVRNQKIDGSEVKDFVINLTVDQYINYQTIGPNGEFYYIQNESKVDRTDPNNEIWSSELTLIALDADGNEILRQRINEENSPEYYLNQFIVLKDGTMLFNENRGIALYDAAGKFQKLVLSTQDKDWGISSMFLLKGETPAVMRFDYEKNTTLINKIDLTKGALSEDYVLPDQIKNGVYYPGEDFDFYVADSSAIYGYNLGDTGQTTLMNFIDSDLSTTYISKVCSKSKDELYGKTVDSLTGMEIIYKFTKIPADQVADKKILNLAGYYVNDDFRIRSIVVKFNKTNPDYRITIKDYSQYNTEDDYMAGMNKLNTDIASGVVPDILILNGNFSVKSYENKGVFEDLYPYIDNDPELKRTDYYENVFEAYSTKGKLYRLPASFSVFTVMGKTSEVGEKTGWNFDEFRAYVESKPETAKILENTTRSNLLMYAINLSSSQFINWETGECDFNSPGFTYLLELAKTFPATWEEIDADMSRKYDPDSYRKGDVLLYSAYLSDFDMYNQTKKITFGEDVTMIGFPAENKIGSAIQSDYLFSMSSKSKNKEGIWQFIRQILLADYQENIVYGFPISKAATNKLAEEAMKEETMEDENGNLVPYQPTYYNGETEIPIPPVTQTEIDEVINFISSVKQPYYDDQQLFNIIEEEAAPYFAGQKDVKAVVDIIQSRVKIYVNENR